MANQEQVNHLYQGVTDWNTWRENHSTEFIDLKDANLNGANLSRANLWYAELSGANLSGANLNGANLSYADLSGADLSGADLSYADLSRAHLGSASLWYADLSGANLREARLNATVLNGAVLNGADLSYAKIAGTSFGDQDLRVVKGLETLRHRGPSPLSITTVYKSQGDIPNAFVRGCGVPDAFLEYMKALASKPFEYYTCFLSYSSKDEAFANRLYTDLQHQGVRCWFAPEDLKIGDEIQPRIDETIRLFDKLLVVLSKHSIASNWVAYEVKNARQKEPQGIPNILFPIRIDDTILTCNTSWAQDIKQTRHIGDFSHWKDYDAYQHALSRLLRDLKAEGKA